MKAFPGATGLVIAACATAPSPAITQATNQAPASACSVEAATPWMGKWFAAWELTSERILRIPDIPAPNVVFFDSACVYSTSERTAAGPAVPGPAIRGSNLLWRAARHNDSLTMPNSDRLPVQLLSFTNVDRNTRRPFFVMAAPSYWISKGLGSEPGLTAVFLHEFSHTRQVKGFSSIIGPIDDAWNFEFDLDDDAVQKRFQADSTYVAAYMAERDLLYRAAEADSIAEVRALARQALDMIRARHARWLVGENAVFSILDDTWLSLEGAAQWAGHAWLAHPEGGGLTKQAAIAHMSGRRRFWAQDEGLAIFLVVDRLMPAWPALVFSEPSVGAITLLERAVQQ